MNYTLLDYLNRVYVQHSKDTMVNKRKHFLLIQNCRHLLISWTIYCPCLGYHAPHLVTIGIGQAVEYRPLFCFLPLHMTEWLTVWISFWAISRWYWLIFIFVQSENRKSAPRVSNYLFIYQGKLKIGITWSTTITKWFTVLLDFVINNFSVVRLFDLRNTKYSTTRLTVFYGRITSAHQEVYWFSEMCICHSVCFNRKSIRIANLYWSINVT